METCNYATSIIINIYVKRKYDENILIGKALTLEPDRDGFTGAT